LATQIGNLVNYTELSNASDLEFQNLKKHLNILEQTYIISLIRPYFANKRTELTKNPKAYFLDTGLRNLVIDNFNKFSLREDTRALVENFVFRTLQQKYAGVSGVYFWRTKSKAEVDFVLKKEEEIIPIEVKYSLRPTVGKSLHSFIKKFSPRKGLVLTKDYSKEIKIDKTRIIFIPVFYL